VYYGKKMLALPSKISKRLSMKKHLITSALPYANGPLHFGHIAGVYLPADIYTRHKKFQGLRAIHISGSDEHGVAIMQNAQKEKKNYKEYVDNWHKVHKDLFELYDIKFDYFGQTSSDYHAEEVVRWFKELYDKGFIEKQEDKQLQCQDCKNYLPDRFVEGTCYECGYEEARGDECPKCGTWVDSIKLINPVCKFCESKNIEIKEVDQWYLMLSKYHKEFREWFKTKSHWKKTVVPFIDSLSKEGMVDRAITRDLDWGIDVPLEEAKGKKLYVWFDAPIGYVSNTKEYLKTIGSNEDYLKDWWNNQNVEITNFIGKDNVIFHSIIFPVMCMASGIARPVDELPANQYLNFSDKQFSKSKGNVLDAVAAAESFGSDTLRYYLISLIPETVDTNFTWTGFENKVNGELANNIGNFVSRSMSFVKKNWSEEGLSKESFEGWFDSKEVKELQTKVKSIQGNLDKVLIRRSNYVYRARC
jgi:methionyl-tRNA synthetase